ncbi:acylphosphatase [Aquiflexum sp. TKW24L]|uniref:acylphosphatase n=1 Tax=Aquiflexum sp. TKW24L TaxID=2942212 RepID=UPI0020BD8493|nr:acylphosphatase [Aquiflexum sp. TKW24L]MCL6261385.1 acylphosphatase [Aquiflexum sp. TKW24L]
MKINKRIKVSGKVQGVFFRNSAQQKALEFGIKGWVRNESDGTVLMEIEGGPDAILKMENWLRQGPPLAKIQSIEIFEGDPLGHTGFIILK